MPDKARLERYLEMGLTVGELIEELKTYPEDNKVVFAYNFGDHTETQVTEKVSHIEDSTIRWSGYHRMPKTVDLDDIDDEQREEVEEECVNVIILFP